MSQVAPGPLPVGRSAAKVVVKALKAGLFFVPAAARQTAKLQGPRPQRCKAARDASGVSGRWATGPAAQAIVERGPAHARCAAPERSWSIATPRPGRSQRSPAAGAPATHGAWVSGHRAPQSVAMECSTAACSASSRAVEKAPPPNRCAPRRLGVTGWWAAGPTAARAAVWARAVGRSAVQVVLRSSVRPPGRPTGRAATWTARPDPSALPAAGPPELGPRVL